MSLIEAFLKYMFASCSKVITENPDLAKELEQIQADLSEEEEEKLNQQFTTAYALLSREDVLDIIADDIVRHYLGR